MQKRTRKFHLRSSSSFRNFVAALIPHLFRITFRKCTQLCIISFAATVAMLLLFMNIFCYFIRCLFSSSLLPLPGIGFVCVCVSVCCSRCVCFSLLLRALQHISYCFRWLRLIFVCCCCLKQEVNFLYYSFCTVWMLQVLSHFSRHLLFVQRRALQTHVFVYVQKLQHIKIHIRNSTEYWTCYRRQSSDRKQTA